MQLTAPQHETAAKAIYQAEQTGTWTEPVSNTDEQADVEDAYRIGMEVRDLKVAAGRTVKGHKIGFTSKAMRSLVGATEPDYGFLYDDSFVSEGSTVPRGADEPPTRRTRGCVRHGPAAERTLGEQRRRCSGH